MIVKMFLGILMAGTMVALTTIFIFEADAAVALGPASTSGMLMSLGFLLVGVGMWGRKKTCHGTPIDGRL